MANKYNINNKQAPLAVTSSIIKNAYPLSTELTDQKQKKEDSKGRNLLLHP